MGAPAAMGGGMLPREASVGGMGHSAVAQSSPANGGGGPRPRGGVLASGLGRMRPPAGAPVVEPDRRPFFEHPVPNTTRFVHAGFSGISAASPPADYPRLARMSELLDAWNPDHVEAIPTPFVERLAVFNFSDRAERATAALYRDAEVVLHKAELILRFCSE